MHATDTEWAVEGELRLRAVLCPVQVRREALLARCNGNAALDLKMLAPLQRRASNLPGFGRDGRLRQRATAAHEGRESEQRDQRSTAHDFADGSSRAIVLFTSAADGSRASARAQTLRAWV